MTDHIYTDSPSEGYARLKKRQELFNKRGKSMSEYKEKLTRKVEKQRALKNKMK